MILLLIFMKCEKIKLL